MPRNHSKALSARRKINILLIQQEFGLLSSTVNSQGVLSFHLPIELSIDLLQCITDIFILLKSGVCCYS